MIRTVYLKSYDLYVEILEYELPEGRAALWQREDFLRFGVALTFGNFMRERERVAGIFATPEGPVFFLDSRHVLLRNGHVTATVVKEPDKPVMHFTLKAEEESFELTYAERHGIGTNPYDNEIEDVDLLAWLVRGIGSPAFFQLFTKAWVY